MKKIITPQGTEIKVETEIKFVVSEKKEWYEHPYSRETTSRYVYAVNRKLMAQDFDYVKGSRSRYNDAVILEELETGTETYATFKSIELAKIFCEALNAKSQKELSNITNSAWLYSIAV